MTAFRQSIDRRWTAEIGAERAATTDCERPLSAVRSLSAAKALYLVARRAGRWEGVVGEEVTSMSKTHTQQQDHRQAPWNKGRLIGQKRPLKPKEVWNIRARLQIEAGKRELAMFNLAIDSKLRGCDLVRLKIDDLCVGGRLRDRATIIQKKTGRPVQFELTEQTRASVEDWLAILKIRDGRFLFPSRVHEQHHISTPPKPAGKRAGPRALSRAGADGGS